MQTFWNKPLIKNIRYLIRKIIGSTRKYLSKCWGNNKNKLSESLLAPLLVKKKSIQYVKAIYILTISLISSSLKQKFGKKVRKNNGLRKNTDLLSTMNNFRICKINHRLREYYHICKAVTDNFNDVFIVQLLCIYFTLQIFIAGLPQYKHGSRLWGYKKSRSSSLTIGCGWKLKISN